MSSTVIGMVLGLLVGLRHAFEPDHLTAVSTLVGETHGLRGGALLGVLWGVGHTISIVAVGVILMLLGASLPARASVIFELCVAAMLLVLGVRAIVIAVRASAGRGHHHARHHAPSDPEPIEPRAWTWRPLAVGLVHGLAGSGALTAIVFAELDGAVARVILPDAVRRRLDRRDGARLGRRRRDASRDHALRSHPPRGRSRDRPRIDHRRCFVDNSTVAAAHVIVARLHNSVANPAASSSSVTTDGARG